MSYTLLKETVRTARKQHRCIWCPEQIEPGQKYHDVRGVYDGELQQNLWHPECREASFIFFRTNDEDCFAAHEFKRGSSEESFA